MSKGLGAAMAGGNPREGREEDDFYPTPLLATIAFMQQESKFIGPKVWECACGTGEMAEAIKSFGHEVVSTDLVDRGYGEVGDFLSATEPMANQIITNPPFNLAVKFIEQALGNFEVDYFALLLKSTFWHAKTRYPLFQKYQPSAVYPLLWRPDFLGRGRPTMEVAWTVWDRKRQGQTIYQPLMKPV